MKVFRMSLIILLLFSSYIYADSAVVAQHTVITKSGVFLSRGSIVASQPMKRVSEVIEAQGTWGQWITQGLDGKDPVSAKFIGLLTGISWDESRSLFGLEFGVNLPWPIGSSGNWIYFDSCLSQNLGSCPDELKLTLEKPGLFINDVVFTLTLEELSETQTRVSFELAADFVWFLRPFITLDEYSHDMNIRLVRIMQNLAAWLET